MMKLEELPKSFPDVDDDTLEWLSFAASVVTDPETATAKQLRQARKQILKYYLPTESIPVHLRPYLAPDVPDKRFFAFLCACDDHMQARKVLRLQEMAQLVSDLPPDCAQLLLQIVRGELNIRMCRRVGDELHLYAGSCECDGVLIRHLILRDAHGLPTAPMPEHITPEGILSCDADGRFAMPLRVTLPPSAFTEEERDEHDDACDGPLSCTVTFSGASMEFITYRADPMDHPAGPWMRLMLLAEALLEKHDALPHTLNEKERALLPLLTELHLLQQVSAPPQMHRFPLLTTMATESGCTRLSRLLNNPHIKYDRLLTELALARNEVLWRRIAALLADSQTDYPSVRELFPAPDALRAQITDILHANGYTGTYPDFEKRGLLSHTCLAQSDFPFAKNRGHWLLRGRPGIYRIHCTEHFDTNCSGMTFECVSHFPKPGEPELDRISCMFDHGDRCFTQHVCYSSDASLPQALLLAMLNAERRAPDHEQRKMLELPSKAENLRIALLLGLLLGVLFGVLFTPAMALLTALPELIFGHGAFLASLKAFPWLVTLCGSVVGFGGFLSLYLWHLLE